LVLNVELTMKRRSVSLPEIGLIAGTRMALGAGIGLLLAERLNDDQRRAVGWTLLAVGALTTLPLAVNVLSGDRVENRSGRMSSEESDASALAHA
jgi:hypothetical protein